MRLWLALALVLATACGGSEAAPGGRVDPRGPRAASGGPGRGAAGPADTLPEIALPDLSGQTRPLRVTADEVTLINFWATWCVPCLREIPELVALQDSLGASGLRVVGVAIDSGDRADIREFARRHHMTYAILTADYAWARRHFDVFGLPVTLLVDRDGWIRRRMIGPQTRAQFVDAVREFL